MLLLGCWSDKIIMVVVVVSSSQCYAMGGRVH